MAAFLATFIDVLFKVLSFAIFARVLLSWFPISRDSPLILILDEITEPILRPLRRIVPRLGILDITPIVALVMLQVLQGILMDAVRKL